MSLQVRQGDLYWLDLDEPDPNGFEPGYRRPVVVIQNDEINASNIGTTTICTLTTSSRRKGAPGNVLLNQGEGNLPKQSVVNVSQLLTIDKRDLQDYIGTLSNGRIDQIIEGVILLLRRS